MLFLNRPFLKIGRRLYMYYVHKTAKTYLKQKQKIGSRILLILEQKVILATPLSSALYLCTVTIR